MSMNNKFKAQTLTGNHTGNYSCEFLASLALHMSCSLANQRTVWIKTDNYLVSLDQRTEHLLENTKIYMPQNIS